MSSASPTLRPAVFSKVINLQPDSKGDNLKVKVLTSNTVVNKARPDGSTIRVAEILIGDDTGQIILTARNNQIDIAKPGSHIIIRNSKIDMFKGFMRLAVDKWGNITEDPNPESWEVGGKNLSEVEYELVRVDQKK